MITLGTRPCFRFASDVSRAIITEHSATPLSGALPAVDGDTLLPCAIFTLLLLRDF